MAIDAAQIENTMNTIVWKIGEIVQNRAVELVPVDTGELKTSITHKEIGNKTIVYTDVDYAEDMEYGKPPGILSDEEKQDIEDWALRHGLNPNAIQFVIAKRGIKVGTEKSPMKTPSGYRPFLRPAFHQSQTKIREMIKEELSKL